MSSLETHNILDTALGLQFNECSIIAADACKFAEKAYEPYAADRFLILPSEVDGEAVAHSTEIACTVVGKARVADEDVTYSVSKPHTDGPLTLLAVLNDGVAIPIATFRRRNSACDYVQLGTEMNHEDIVATRSEPRAAYVGAISMLLQEKADTDHFKLLEDLFLEEWDRCATQHYDMYTKSVYGMMQTNWHAYEGSIRNAQFRKIWPNGKSEGVHSATVRRLAFGKQIPAEDVGRHALAVMQEAGSHTYSFGCIARQNSFVPLIECGKNGVVDLRAAAEIQPLAIEDLAMFRGLLMCQQAAATELAHATKGMEDILGREVGTRHTDLFRAHIEDRFLYAVSDARLLPDEKIAENVAAYIAHEDAVKRAKTALVDLHGQFSTQYDMHRITEELLGNTDARIIGVAEAIKKLLLGEAQKMSGKGTLADRKIGTTATSALIELVCESGPDNTISVTVSGRPTSLTDSSFETLHQNTLALYRPILEKDAATIALVHELLQTIKLYEVTSDNKSSQSPRRRLFGRREATV